MFFIDNWSQAGHSVSCMTILYLQMITSETRPHVKWVVNLVIAYGHFNVPHVFVWVNVLTLPPQRVDFVFLFVMLTQTYKHTKQN